MNAPGLAPQVRADFCGTRGSGDTGRTDGTYCTITEGAIDWTAIAQPLAGGERRDGGYRRVRDLAIVDPGPPVQGSPGLGYWEYDHIRNQGDTEGQLRGRQFRLYSVTCEKKARGRR